jgi:hypothetical protein
MVEITSDRPLFKTILVEMAYSVIHLHNRVNKSKIAVLLLCPEELELGKHLRCLPRCDHWKLLAVLVIVIIYGQWRWLELLDDSLCNVIVSGHAGNCLLIRIVATLLWVKWEDETPTPKVGDLESSGTPECLEFDNRGQNTLHWGVLGVIGKVLKCRYRK